MAKRIAFRPNPVDPHLELEKRLAAAPREHAEALLVAYDVLQEAHDKGLLDMVHGAIGAKDTIFGKIAEFAKTPEGIAGLRNLLAGVKILTAVDPETLDQLYSTLCRANAEHKKETTPPSMWEIAKRAMSEDGRRGLSFATLLLTGFGRSLKR